MRRVTFLTGLFVHLNRCFSKVPGIGTFAGKESEHWSFFFYAALRTVFCGICCFLLFSGKALSDEKNNAQPPSGEQLLQLCNDGHWKDAYELSMVGLRHKEADREMAGLCYNVAELSLECLGRRVEREALWKETIALHGDKWRVLAGDIMGSCITVDPYFDINFRKMTSRDGVYRKNKMVLCQEALDALDFGGTPEQKDRVLQEYIWAVLSGRNNSAEDWKWLATLTDIKSEKALGASSKKTELVPENSGDDIIFYEEPASFTVAKNDGERWLALLRMREALNVEEVVPIDLEKADLARSCFGVDHLKQSVYGSFPSGDFQSSGGLFDLKTLKDDETVVLTSTGPQLIRLPSEYDYISIYKRHEVWLALADIYEARRNFPKTVFYLEKAMGGPDIDGDDDLSQRLREYIGNLGRFEANVSQSAGNDIAFDFTFRNGHEVTFSACRIDLEKYADDWGNRLRNSRSRLVPPRLDEMILQAVATNHVAYLDNKMIEWTVILQPVEPFVEKTITVKAPFEESGAYLVSAQMKEGNTSKTILWVSGLSIVEKNYDADEGRYIYYLADSKTGAPVTDAELSFFGYANSTNRTDELEPLLIKEFSLKTDSMGLAYMQRAQAEIEGGRWPTYWISAKAPDGRYAFYESGGLYRGNDWHHYFHRRDMDRAYVATDRPIYRPGHDVKFKAWVQYAQYGDMDERFVAGRTINVFVRDNRGDDIFKGNYIRSHAKINSLNRGLDTVVPFSMKACSLYVEFSHLSI